jgi:hypothetical protein
MSIAVTLYIIATLILFFLNMVANIFALSLTEKNRIPVATLVATIFAIAFVIWGITILVNN